MGNKRWGVRSNEGGRSTKRGHTPKDVCCFEGLIATHEDVQVDVGLRCAREMGALAERHDDEPDSSKKEINAI